MNTRYVLWVRHCQSCANVAMKGIPNIMAQMYRQPLCTKKGIHQSYAFGEELGKVIDNILKTYNLDGVKFYASYLPRAVETAKLISAKCPSKKNSQINRIPFVNEHIRFYNKSSGTQNITDIYKSNCHVRALNTILSIGLDINEDHLFEDIMKNMLCKSVLHKNGSINKCVITENPDNYNNFKKKILPKLTLNKLHIIVSHGKYIRRDVLAELDWPDRKINNLEANLVKYTKDGSIFKGECIESKELTKCNNKINEIKRGDISKLPLNEEYKNYFNCKYRYHDKSKILRLKRKSSIQKYC